MTEVVSSSTEALHFYMHLFVELYTMQLNIHFKEVQINVVMLVFFL